MQFLKIEKNTPVLSGRVFASVGLLIASSVIVSGCVDYKSRFSSAKSSSGPSKFAPSKYGVSGSPKVDEAEGLRKGGGYRKVGKPYKIAGKWYHPKDYKSYKKVGKASWYGPTFHGRLTANGEVFDRNALTAAHPTLPMPSYVRVTNVKNNRSLIVRVNDRGPYHGNRVIDLSERAATMLDYKGNGVATLKIVYLGKAPLHGLDEKMLLSSYRGPGGGTGRGISDRTLVASTATPSYSANAVTAFTPKAKPTNEILKEVSRIAIENPQLVGKLIDRLPTGSVKKTAKPTGQTWNPFKGVFEKNKPIDLDAFSASTDR